MTSEFRMNFKEGVDSYIVGDWSTAKTFLEVSNSIMKTNCPLLNGDGPSLTLLKYMDHYDYKPPSSWKGFRPLTSK